MPISGISFQRSEMRIGAFAVYHGGAIMRPAAKLPVLIWCLCCLAACREQTPLPVPPPPEPKNEPVPVSVDHRQLVRDWDKAHNTKDIALFAGLFDSSVLFYGTKYKRTQCLDSKRKLFVKYPEFYQHTQGDIVVEHLPDGTVKCSFLKRVVVEAFTRDYPSYLVFRQLGDEWKIVVEGDLVTDRNLAKRRRK